MEDKINLAIVVLDEDVEIWRSVTKAEVFVLRNADCVLKIPLSVDGNTPITHQASFTIVKYEDYLQIYKVIQYFKSKNFYFEHSIKCDIKSFIYFLNDLNLKIVRPSKNKVIK